MPIRDAILLAVFILSVPVCFMRPFYGIVLWTIVAFLNPQAYLWSARSFPWAMIVAVPTLAGFFVFSRGWMSRVASRELVLLVVLWIWFTGTALVSTHTPLFMHHAADTWNRWQFVSKILLMTVVTVAITDSFDRLRRIVLVIAGCFGFFVVKSFPFMILTGGAHRLYGPEQSMIGDNNDFGLALTMTLPFFFFLARTETKPLLKRVFLAVALITVPAVCFTYSRGAMVGMTAVLAMMLLQMKRRFALIPLLALGLITAVLLAPPAWKERMNPAREGAIDASALSRINAWTFSWRLASDFPLAGGGFSTFTPELFSRYAPNPQDVHGPHSIYFQVLAEHGFPGLALYLMLVFSAFSALRRLRKLGYANGDDLLVGYSNMFRFSLVGFLVSGTFLGRAYFDYFFTIVACIVILKQVHAIEWTESEATDPELVEEAA